MQALERVGDRLATLVGDRAQTRQRRARLGDVASPDEALTRDPLRGEREVRAGVGDLRITRAEVVDGGSAQAAAPRERVQGRSLDLGPRVAARVDGLLCPLLGLA